VLVGLPPLLLPPQCQHPLPAHAYVDVLCWLSAKADETWDRCGSHHQWRGDAASRQVSQAELQPRTKPGVVTLHCLESIHT
jgi:hypothetical protein